MFNLRNAFKFFCATLFFAFSTSLPAEDLNCLLVASQIIVDGSADDWLSVEKHPLFQCSGGFKIARTPERIYFLLQIGDPEAAYLVLCQGFTICVDKESGQSTQYSVCYSASKKLAKEIEENHNPLTGFAKEKMPPFPDEAPPSEERFPPKPSKGNAPPADNRKGPPSGGPNLAASPPNAEDLKSQVKKVFKKTMDPGILLVTKGKKESIQLECLKEGVCAASSYEDGFFNYEISIPWADVAELVSLPGGEISRKIRLGLKIPVIQMDAAVREESPPQGMTSGDSGNRMGGDPSGGMGGGPSGGMSGGPGGGMSGGPGGGMGGGPGGGMGGGPGSGMGGGPGGGMSGSPGKGGPGGFPKPTEGPSYSVVANVQWYSLIISASDENTADSQK